MGVVKLCRKCLSANETFLHMKCQVNMNKNMKLVKKKIYMAVINAHLKSIHTIKKTTRVKKNLKCSKFTFSFIFVVYHDCCPATAVILNV